MGTQIKFFAKEHREKKHKKNFRIIEHSGELVLKLCMHENSKLSIDFLFGVFAIFI